MKTRRQRAVKIGMLTAPMPNAGIDRAQSYIDRDYEAWVEMSGANAVIIPYNTPDLDSYLKRVHGIILVGGAIENRATHDARQYNQLVGAIKRIFNFAVSENQKGRHFVVWGTCLGFDFLAMMGEHLRTNFFREDHIQPAHKFRSAPLVFTGPSRIRAQFSREMREKMAREPVATHMHEFGFDLASPHVQRLLKHLKVVSVDSSDGGTRFINIFEYKKYPFYGSQWHPEKPKGELAVQVSTVLSHFLKKECAKNKARVPLWGKTFGSKPFKSKESVLVKGGEKPIQTHFF